MISRIIRTLIFNLAFYLVHLVLFIVFLPSFFLPRPTYMAWIRFYTEVIWFLERTLLDLDYELRGLEYLPDEPPYLIAAKHQSAYETFKLHILFGDPAIILKQELLKIPMWGKYLEKTDVIAIDRSSPETAIQSIQGGAKRMVAQGRPIVIYPQGTRVNVDDTPAEKPYKVGVARIQEAVNLPVIPVATNSGYFWPRHGWLKRPGKVVFEFLAPIEPGLERRDLLQKLEERTEKASNNLLQEAKDKYEQRHKGRWSRIFLIAINVLAIFYTAGWFFIASHIEDNYANFEHDAIERVTKPVNIMGFPFGFTLRTDEEQFRYPYVDVFLQDLEITGCPLSQKGISFQASPVEIVSPALGRSMRWRQLTGMIDIEDQHVVLENITMSYGDYKIAINGQVKPDTKPWPSYDVIVSIAHYREFMQSLLDFGIIKQNDLLIAVAAMSAFDKDGTANVPMRLEQDGALFIGPLRVARLPELDQGIGNLPVLAQ